MVYLVYTGDEWENWVVDVFATRELAEKHICDYCGCDSCDDAQGMWIEEREVKNS